MNSKFKEGDSVIYKGKEYTLIKEETPMSEIKSGATTKIVETRLLKTVEEHKDHLENGNFSSFQNWIQG